MSRLVTTVCVALSMFAIAGAAFATSYPGYTCYTLPGCNFANQISGAQAWSLLPNGTVIGDTTDVQIKTGGLPGFPYTEACTWSISNGQVVTTQMGDVAGLNASGNSVDSAPAVYGDSQGRYAVSIDNVGPIGLWNGTSFTSLAPYSSNLQRGGGLYGETPTD